MARPPNPLRWKVKTKTLTLKLTDAERRRLRELVTARERELHEQTGQQIDLTASAYIRWLMDQDAERMGIEKRSKKATRVAKKARRTPPR